MELTIALACGPMKQAKYIENKPIRQEMCSQRCKKRLIY